MCSRPLLTPSSLPSLPNQTQNASALADEWVEVLDKDENYWDQNAFNDLFRRGGTPDLRRPDRLFSGYDRKLKVGILPVAQFCSGHTFFVQRLPEAKGVQP
jgi:arabinosyltransferase